MTEVCCGRMVNGECCGRTLAALAVSRGKYASTFGTGLTCTVVAVTTDYVTYQTNVRPLPVSVPADVFLQHWRPV